MIVTTTLIVFALGFAFLFSWMKLKYQRTWSFTNICACAVICALVATIGLYLVLGYVILLLSYAIAFMILAALVVAGVWMADKVFR